MPALTAATLSVKDRAAELGAKPAADRVGDGDEGRGDRGGARAAVGVEDVGVDMDRPGPERLAVDDRAQAAADQPLDLGGPAVGAAPDPRRGAPGQHGVFGRQPADRLPLEKRRHRVGQARRHQDRVSPERYSTLPGLLRTNPRSIVTGRSWSNRRLSDRVMRRFVLCLVAVLLSPFAPRKGFNYEQILSRSERRLSIAFQADWSPSSQTRRAI